VPVSPLVIRPLELKLTVWESVSRLPSMAVCTSQVLSAVLLKYRVLVWLMPRES